MTEYLKKNSKTFHTLPFPVSEPLKELQLSLLFCGDWVLIRFHHRPVWKTHPPHSSERPNFCF